MPSKTQKAKSPARKPQPRRTKAATKPAPVAKAPEVVPGVTEPAPSALFDPPASSAPAVAPAVEIAASSEAPANPFKADAPAPQGDRSGDENAEALTAPVAATAEALTAPSAPAVEPDPAPAPAVLAPIVETSDEPRTVRLGVVSATLLRLPLGEVLAHMDTFMSKLAAVAETKASLDLQPQMLATEGRCAPIYFTGDADDGDIEHPFDGLEAAAAAVALGLETVSVIVIAPGDAGAAQNHLAAHRVSQLPKDPEESFLRAVTAYQEVVPPASPAP